MANLGIKFLQCGIVEHSGHGVPIVVREYGEKAYTFSENMITVTIPFDKPETKSGEITGEIKLKENEESIYEAIKENPFISRQNLIEKCEVSKNTLDKILKKLKEKGLIKGRTSNRNGQWIIWVRKNKCKFNKSDVLSDIGR